MNKLYIRLHTVTSNFKKYSLSIGLLLLILLPGKYANGQSGVATNPVVSINQAAIQPDPANLTPIHFTVMFDQPVIGFATGDLVISGTAGATTAVVTGGPNLFNVSVSGMTSCGTVIVNIPAGICTNALLEPNLASTSLDNTVTYLTGNPGVTINQAASQPDPALASPINFTVQFDQPVIGFATGDVGLSGTAGATTATVTGSGATYNVAVSGITASGTVIASIAAGVCTNACAASNNTSTSTDNTVTINCVPPVVNVTPAVSCGSIQGVGSNPCNPLTASGNANVYIWSPLAGLYIDCNATLPYTGDNRAVVYAAPTVSVTYTVTGTILATGCSASATARVNYTPPAPVVTPSFVNMCLGDPAVKLKVQTAQTAQFCSGPVNIAVPDNNPAGATSAINVSGIPAAATLTEIRVTINMPHTKIGNMVFVLRAPNVAILNLDYHLGATGGTGATTGFVNTVISSLGGAVLSAGTNPYTGTFSADAQGPPAGGFGASGPTGMWQTVSNWSGLVPLANAANGNWTLGFYDGVTGDVGTLTSWCISFTYSTGSSIPATPAIWSPAAGLFADAASAVPYIPGTQVDSVWARPTPAGVYPYQVSTFNVPALLCSPATNFLSNNGDGMVTFNVKNNHPFPIKLWQINSRTLTAVQTSVSAYYKASAINGPPGFISAANGWNQFGGGSIAGTGTGVQPFLTNLQLVIPAGVTYGICIRATTFTSLPNLAFGNLTAGNYSFNNGGCELTTGTNIGYSGNTNTPSTPLSGFVGSLQFADAGTTCTSPPRTVVVTVGQPATITSQPVNQNVCVDSTATFSVGVAGAGPFSYQWQTSTNGGGTWVNLVNGGGNIGVNTPTLTIGPVAAGMNGYQYRLAIGSCPASIYSNAALLTTNPLPTASITANPLIIGPTQTTTIYSTITGGPATYAWYYNGVLLTGAIADTLLVTYGSAGDYQLKVTNSCGVGTSNIISIANSFAYGLLAYPNPGMGLFEVRYRSEPNNTVQRSIVVYNNRGERILTKTFTQTTPYQKTEVDIRAFGKGLYWIELKAANGERLATGRVVVQ